MNPRWTHDRLRWRVLHLERPSTEVAWVGALGSAAILFGGSVVLQVFGSLFRPAIGAFVDAVALPAPLAAAVTGLVAVLAASRWSWTDVEATATGIALRGPWRRRVFAWADVRSVSARRRTLELRTGRRTIRLPAPRVDEAVVAGVAAELERIRSAPPPPMAPPPEALGRLRAR